MDVVSTYNYTKKRRIDDGQGQNSLGVFRAFDPQVQGDVAVKEIAKSSFPDSSMYFQEAGAMFQSGHPNVVAVKVAVQTDHLITLVMPLYERGSLASRIEAGPIALSDAIRVGQQILAGAGAIHARRTIHFDIKPSNVLFSDRNVAMIADFGQARQSGPTGVALMPNRMYGPSTPPEAFTNGRRGTVLSDIYQVGMTLYRAVNGDPWFNEEFAACAGDLERKIMAGRFPSRRFLPHVPDRLRRIIRKAMNPVPEKRYNSATEFSNALAKVSPKNNWRTTLAADHSIEWTAVRKSQPSLQIVLTPRGLLWDIEVRTVRAAVSRRSRTDRWRSSVDRTEALTHLSQLFADLE